MTTLEKIRAELHATAEMHEDGDYYLRDKWVDEIIDKYAEQEPTTRQSCENCKQDRKECGNDDHYGFCQNWKKAEQEPCDDVVSRQAVLEIAKQHTLTNAYLAIQKLPSVRPQPICEEREKGECPYYAG